MCGIAGFRLLRDDGGDAASDLQLAVSALAHRGPDDQGLWADPDESVGLGFRRLSILDLSELGHQPMVSTCGEWTMVYNGEVYNFRSIRRDLEARGRRFRSTGDSEVVLSAFAEWGLDAVHRFVGMFAIALWHSTTRTLHLIRDRLGVKPIYYHWDGRSLFFGSELKAIRAFSGWAPTIDLEALGDYLRYGYIADPRTIYRQVSKLPPAHRAALSAEGALSIERYWTPFSEADKRVNQAEAVLAEELEALLIDAFKLRLVSDVPVGVFLSGGVDSSLVAALLRKNIPEPVETFTIGFEASESDESRHAQSVAAHLGTRHHTRVVRSEDAKRLLPRWAELYDEPFGDESGIPTFLVAELAADNVVVALSADGGDELFAGYDSYTTALSRLRRLERMPNSLRDLVARAAQVTALFARDSGRVHGIRRQLEADGPGMIFDDIVSLMSPAEVSLLLGVDPPERRSADVYPGTAGERFCAWDLEHYLPGDVLTKVDRATMAASLEGREPLLDHRIVEFAFSLPYALRRGPLGAKHLLKRVLFDHVPRTLVDRPKQGFAVPVTDWLAGDLRSLTADVLDPSEIARAGIFDPAMVRSWIERLDRGDRIVRRKVWLLVAFQLWHRHWMSH